MVDKLIMSQFMPVKYQVPSIKIAVNKEIISYELQLSVWLHSMLHNLCFLLASFVPRERKNLASRASVAPFVLFHAVKSLIVLRLLDVICCKWDLQRNLR